jgi:hypothetical protein
MARKSLCTRAQKQESKGQEQSQLGSRMLVLEHRGSRNCPVDALCVIPEILLVLQPHSADLALEPISLFNIG